jgi:SAM-dependent methyltransferase
VGEEFWEDPARVEQFAARDPDHRLVELLARYPDPRAVPVLDLGCAGGRNTELLARRGFPVHAVDASAAMVARTRVRIAPIVGDDEARARVRRGRMDDLGHHPDATFALVVALGVFHAARDHPEWDRAADEVARILQPGGLLLFSQFTPGTDLTGDGVTPVAGEPGVYDGLPGGRAVLLEAASVDRAMAARGLLPVAPSQTVTVSLEVGRRVSVNALYAKG